VTQPTWRSAIQPTKTDSQTVKHPDRQPKCFCMVWLAEILFLTHRCTKLIRVAIYSTLNLENIYT